MSNTWVNLHCHTVFSSLDGYGSVEDYAQRASSLSMPALAITDHGTLSGWPDFYDACTNIGVKPILGIELYMARKTRFDRDDEERAGPAIDELAQRGPYHLTVLARNQIGVRNLMKLSSYAFMEGIYVKPRADWELLERFAEGLIILSGCLNGPVPQALMRGDPEGALAIAGRMQEMVGKENFFIEIMDHGIDEEKQVWPGLVEIAKKINAPLVPTGDSHYVSKSDSEIHDTMLCVSTNARVDDEGRFAFRPEEFHLKSYEEMMERFPQEWLHNTLNIGEMVEPIPFYNDKMYFPEFDIPTDEHPYDYFERMVWEGVHNKYGVNPSEEVISRVIYELRTIKKLGFPQYFLVVSDFVNWMKNQGIAVGPGRGSAAGSIASYAMGITNIEPLEYGLMFERFLVPEEVEYTPTFEKV